MLGNLRKNYPKRKFHKIRYLSKQIYVVVNLLFQLIFIFPFFLGMIMYANEFETKGNKNLTEMKI